MRGIHRRITLATLALVAAHGVAGSPDRPQLPKPRLIAFDTGGRAELGPADAGSKREAARRGAVGAMHRAGPVLVLVNAYLLWFFGGYLGLHHLYLGRNRAALRAGLTFNYGGLGWLYDAFLIPRHARQLMRAGQAGRRRGSLGGGDGAGGGASWEGGAAFAATPSAYATAAPQRHTRGSNVVRGAAGGLGALARTLTSLCLATLRLILQIAASFWLSFPAMILPPGFSPPLRAATQLPGLALALLLGPANASPARATLATAAAAAASAWLIRVSPASAAAEDLNTRRMLEVLFPLLASVAVASLPRRRRRRVKRESHVPRAYDSMLGGGTAFAHPANQIASGGGGFGGAYAEAGYAGAGYGAYAAPQHEYPRQEPSRAAGRERRTWDGTRGKWDHGYRGEGRRGYLGEGEAVVPRRSLAGAALWLAVLLIFYGALVVCSLAGSQVPIAVDGAAMTVDGLRFAGVNEQALVCLSSK